MGLEEKGNCHPPRNQEGEVGKTYGKKKKEAEMTIRKIHRRVTDIWDDVFIQSGRREPMDPTWFTIAAEVTTTIVNIEARL